MATPLRTTVKKNNIKTTAKFRRLTKILTRYHQALMTHGKTDHLDRTIRNTQLMLIQEGNVCKEQWWQAQLEKVELAARCNIKFWKHIKRLSGGSNSHTPILKFMENGSEKIAKTDEQKVNVFTKQLEKTCSISAEENQEFCHETEIMVENELRRNTNELTTEWTINLHKIRDRRHNTLPFNNLDIVNSIRSLKNRAPGASGIRKPYFSNLPPNIISNICHLFNCCYAPHI
ncbi:unnamed protein product, partial [Meganyctiphanes norvegica]